MSNIVNGKNGLRFKIMGHNDLIAKYLKENGDYEPELKSITSQLVGENKGKVLDIGANIGVFSIPLAQLHKDIDFISFEAQSKVFNTLLTNLSLNQIRNVRPVHCGLSDSYGSIKASIPNYEVERNVGAFSLDEEVRRNDYEITTSMGFEEFTLKPLDHFLLKNVSLVKIDVEGMEEKVIRRGLNTLLESNWPPIIFEAWTTKPFYDNRREKLFSFLQNIGYEITEIWQNNLAQHKNRSNKIKIKFGN